MGPPYYGPSEFSLEVEDDLLAHVKVVTATRLRRGEAFMLSWSSPYDGGKDMAGSLWIHASVQVRFVVDTPDPLLLLSRERLDELNRAAQLGGELNILATPT